MEFTQRALRHADLRTTSEHYSDSTEGVSPGIGRLLASGKWKDKTKGRGPKSEGNRHLVIVIAIVVVIAVVALADPNKSLKVIISFFWLSLDQLCVLKSKV